MQNRTAIAIASVALFFSLTGAGFAASHFLITSKRQIAPWVRSALRGEHGARGSTGATGPRGAAGSQGPQGSVGSVDFSRVRVVTAVVTLEPSEGNPAPSGTAIAYCPAGSDVLNGGFSNGPDVSTTQAFAKDPAEWVVTGRLASSAGPETVEAWAECVPAS